MLPAKRNKIYTEDYFSLKNLAIREIKPIENPLSLMNINYQSERIPHIRRYDFRELSNHYADFGKDDRLALGVEDVIASIDNYEVYGLKEHMNNDLTILLQNEFGHRLIKEGVHPSAIAIITNGILTEGNMLVNRNVFNIILETNNLSSLFSRKLFFLLEEMIFDIRKYAIEYDLKNIYLNYY